MAFDGIVIANLVRDLNDKIVSGRISKIAQPEKRRITFYDKRKPGERAAARLSQRQSPASLFYGKQ